MKQLVGALLLLSLSLPSLRGQTNLPLADLSDFQPQDGNWRIVGNVGPPEPKKMPPPPPSPNRKKKKKKKRKAKVQEPIVIENKKENEHKHAELSYEEGMGILLNINEEGKKSHLLTKWEHGDLELSCEVLLPKGSNSGIYLQGRYEVQLFDSWGVKNPSFADMGGIYRNWSNTPGQIYRGKAPISNPSKAPGLWQSLKLQFQAPRFDENGKKIKNARLVFVDLNGVRIHQNVELPLPTGGPISKEEVARGPIMIQGDHGAVALRNISYTLLEDAAVDVQNISYQVYEGEFLLIEDFENLDPVRTGKSKMVDGTVSGLENNYGLIIDGEIKVEKAGTYWITLMQRGGAVMDLDGNRIVDYQKRDAWDNSTKKVELSVGLHPFRIFYYKSSGWIPTGLGLKIKGKNTYSKNLHLYDSYPTKNRMVSQIHLDPGGSPRLLRGFIDFKGDKKRRITHAVAVGNPIGTHYIFDTRTAHVVCSWKGDFLNTTPMWHDRGDGSFRPRGAALFSFDGPAIALLDSSQSKPNFSQFEPSYRSLGYRYKAESDQPVFAFKMAGQEGNIWVQPKDRGKSLLVKVNFMPADAASVAYFKLAEGKEIEWLPGGKYAIDDFSYYIKIHSAKDGKGMILEKDGMKELYVPIPSNNGQLTFEQIW